MKAILDIIDHTFKKIDNNLKKNLDRRFKFTYGN